MSVLFNLVFAVLAIAAFIGGLVSWKLLSRIDALEAKLRRLERRQAVLESAGPETAADVPAQQPVSPGAVAAQAKGQAPTPPAPSVLSRLVGRLVNLLRDNWMIAIGGLCVALAGVFLVKYSIERGLLGPTGRVVLAVVTGLLLHGVAEWLRRRTGGAHPAFAALAGGASITLFAAVLAALHLYQLLPPVTVFLALAAIALGTMALALVHGPVLAIIGLLGAYVVPLLVTTDSGSIVTALLYSLIVGAAALLLMRWVYRPWLWLGVLAGGLGWWLLSLGTTQADDWRGVYLAALAYSMLAIRSGDWLLANAGAAEGGPPVVVNGSAARRLPALPLALALITCAFALSIARSTFGGDALLRWSPLVALLLLAARNRPEIALLPWLSVVLQWFAWLYTALDFSRPQVALVGLASGSERVFLWFALWMSVLYSAISGWHLKTRGFTHWRSSLALLAPLCWLALAYLLVTDLSVIWQWGVVSLAVGLAYLSALQRHPGTPLSAPWLILGAHLAFSLALAMLLREATLTLALAVQLISVTWLIRTYAVSALGWLVKAMVLLVVARLTFNPWLLTYPADIHWSLWTYGGAALCAMIAARLADPAQGFRKWLEAAALHLFVLFLGAEVRYWLYDGDIFGAAYTLTEASINTSLWGALGLVYYYRAGLSATLRPFYALLSRILLFMALVSYGIALVSLNPLWSGVDVSVTPVFNLLLLAYGMPPLLALLARHVYDPRFRSLAGRLAAVGFFIFITLEIRHLWHGVLDVTVGVREGELYTYSGVWLLLAVAAILYAGCRQHEAVYKGGIALLLLVMAKVFLIDMAGLEGLWRVASFMGLGLSLLALAYLYQRVAPRAVDEAPP